MTDDCLDDYVYDLEIKLHYQLKDKFSNSSWLKLFDELHEDFWEIICEQAWDQLEKKLNKEFTK